MPQAKERFRIGVDVGGTFTDIVVFLDSGRIYAKKVPSTPDDYSRAIIDGLMAIVGEFQLDPGAATDVVHGATVATNAILQRAGASTGLITTAGFRDVLEIGRLRRPVLYDMFYEKPKPLVKRSLRLEVTERMDAAGNVVTPLNEAEVQDVLERLVAAGVESVAVAFINSYVNPSHEHAVGEIVKRHYPKLFVSLSADVVPEVKEYERTSTAVINAYVMPLVARYILSLENGLRSMGIEAPLLIMQSSGGIMTAQTARDFPIHTIESGPAAGVVAARAICRTCSYPRAFSFDMGGTTAKAALIEDYQFARNPESEIGAGMFAASRLLKGGGYALKSPSIDIAEVGAGGGSIVTIDQQGMLRVGPESAGAVPGPVCYGLGGKEPTVTDANVVLGYLSPDRLVGGDMKIHSSEATKALEELAQAAGLGLLEAAQGAHDVANANMMRATRAVSSQRGRDPSDFDFIAFGGSGPVHAVGIARALEIKRVIVPRFPGILSAFGLLAADIELHASRSLPRTKVLDITRWRQILEDLSSRAGEVLRADGLSDDSIDVKRFADMRYVGQSSELTIPLPQGEFTDLTVKDLEPAFKREYAKTYGVEDLQEPVEFVNLRVTATGLRELSRPFGSADAMISGLRAVPGDGQVRLRRAYFGPHHGLVETPILSRSDLAGAAPRMGPMIIEEYDTTVVVPPDCSATLDAWGNIVIAVGL